jgi:sigma-54 dependent transcriptional regulator, acetoin dehydrogenase operon transcriptional activator AcoR
MLPVRRSADPARVALEQEGVPSPEFLAPEIYDSWMRCIAHGLDARHPPEAEIVPMATLRQEHQRHSLVRGLALAEMHSLHMQIAGTNFMIAFASPEGLLLDIVSDNSFMSMSDAANIRPGAIWREEVCGTNGVGSVAHSKRAVTVHGGEHFFPRFNNLTCTAAPVFAPDGSLCGILDASSDCLSRQAHTRALVGMAATQVENGLFREQHRGANIITLHNRGEYLHTISAGLLAVDSDGGLLAANRAAQTLLQGLPLTPGRRFSDVFRTRFSTFLEEGRRSERQKLQDEVGSHFVASIEQSRQFPFARPLAKPKPPAAAAVPADFVSTDPRVAETVRRVGAAALRKMPILIRGETGTGKEQLARYAHVASRRGGAFVPVNCAALPDSLIEAELFGYVEGAFTGARKGGSVGLFREADGGTLFLDEIGDMPVGLQAVLLRFLDDWTVRPVGGGSRVVDVLLVAATNADLSASIAKGRFRSDLLYRLNTLEVMLPRLRERTDFAEIVQHLLRAMDPEMRVTERAMERLAHQDWNGNARELRAVLSRLSLNNSGGLIDEDAVADILPEAIRSNRRPAGADQEHGEGNLHELQRARVLAVYAECGENVTKTARQLGVSRNMIYRALQNRSN